MSHVTLIIHFRFSDSVLVFCDVAKNSEQFATAIGKETLRKWCNASKAYNKSKGADTSQLTIANNCFGDLSSSSQITDSAVAAHYGKVNKEFGTLLAGGDMTATNNYMKKAYPAFKKVLC